VIYLVMMALSPKAASRWDDSRAMLSRGATKTVSPTCKEQSYGPRRLSTKEVGTAEHKVSH
jgi:hypothetical protein